MDGSVSHVSPLLVKRVANSASSSSSSSSRASPASAITKVPEECRASVVGAVAAAAVAAAVTGSVSSSNPKPNQVSTVMLYGIPIVSLYIEGQERLCLAQISNTLLKHFSYNEIHNRRVALGITCVQCTPVQLEILRRAGAMPVSSRRCGMITRREAERLCKSFLGDNSPPRLPDDFAFSVHHECAWGCRGSFLPSRYNSSRAKCIKCSFCGLFFSPNKFIFHSHRMGHGDKYIQPDAANFNSWRRHMKLSGNPPEEIIHAWEDVKAMFNGGTRKRIIASSPSSRSSPLSPKRLKETSPPIVSSRSPVTPPAQYPIKPLTHNASNPTTTNTSVNSRLPALPSDLPLTFPRSFMMDYMWHHHTHSAKPSSFNFSSYAIPWLTKRPGHTTPLSIFNQTNADNNSNSFVILTNNNSPSQQSNNLDSPSLKRGQSQFYNSSAFKPVVGASPIASSQISLKLGLTHAIAPPLDEDQLSMSSQSISGALKESISSDDDEMVDIETTEDEVKDERHHGPGSWQFKNEELDYRQYSPLNPQSSSPQSPNIMALPATSTPQSTPTRINVNVGSTNQKYNSNINNTTSSEKCSQMMIMVDNNHESGDERCAQHQHQQSAANASFCPNNNNNIGDVWSIARLQLDKTPNNSHHHNQNMYQPSNGIV